MAAGGVLPDPDPPVRAEIVHQSGRTRVTRLFFAGGTVIRKEPLGPSGERRVRHETAMLERVRGVAGVAQLAEAAQCPGSVVLADAGGTSLAGAAKPLAVDELTGLAVGLARAVAGMHRRGVTHRDIAPANVVLSRDGAPCLVDFALASSFAEMRPGFTHPSEIAGTLAYLAPEATGRTGRPVDQRADLYALGATLYELAAGAPPFGSGDPLRLIHDHLARVPAPPAQVNPAVPEPLSEIIMHLLEKEPDHRHQTPTAWPGRFTVTRRLCAIAEFCEYAVGEELVGYLPAAHACRPRLGYESHATALDRNELGALVVAGGAAPGRARVDLPAGAQRPARVRGHRCGHQAPGLERGHRTLVVVRKGGKVVTVPLAPRTARAVDLAAGERTEGPLFPPARVACAERAARSYWAQVRLLPGRAKRKTLAGKPDAVQARGR